MTPMDYIIIAAISIVLTGMFLFGRHVYITARRVSSGW